jgi:hypothetical protein
VCADGHFAYTKCTCTTLSFLLDQFLGLLDGLSCCHYGGHLAAALVLVLGAVWGLSNDDDGVVKGGCRVAATRSEFSIDRGSSAYAPVLFLRGCAR